MGNPRNFGGFVLHSCRNHDDESMSFHRSLCDNGDAAMPTQEDEQFRFFQVSPAHKGISKLDCDWVTIRWCRHKELTQFPRLGERRSSSFWKGRYPQWQRIANWQLTLFLKVSHLQMGCFYIYIYTSFWWRRPLSDRTVVTFIHGHDATLHTLGGMLTFMWSAYGVDATLHTWVGGGGHVNVHVKCIRCRCYVAYMGWGGHVNVHVKCIRCR